MANRAKFLFEVARVEKLHSEGSRGLLQTRKALAGCAAPKTRNGLGKVLRPVWSHLV